MGPLVLLAHKVLLVFLECLQVKVELEPQVTKVLLEVVVQVLPVHRVQQVVQVLPVLLV
jgi:hypothetical protein